MANFCVVGNGTGIAMRLLVEQAAGQLVRDGHTGTIGSTPDDVTAADAIVAIIDGTLLPETAILLAHAKARDKPTLALRGPGAPVFEGVVRGLMDVVHEGLDTDSLLAGLAPFYERVRPFAGRLVRDQVPRLVREAGHEVRFRELDADDRPRFLKQKLAAEAADLLAAGPGAEKEEIADVLEVLEALIRERGYERDALKQVKQGKHKRRGGFDRCYVVEESSPNRPPSGASSAVHPPTPESGAPVDVEAPSREDPTQWPDETPPKPAVPAPHLDPRPRPRSAAEALVEEVDAEAEAVPAATVHHSPAGFAIREETDVPDSEPTAVATDVPETYDGIVWDADADSPAEEDVTIDTIDVGRDRPGTGSADSLFEAARQRQPRRLFRS